MEGAEDEEGNDSAYFTPADEEHRTSTAPRTFWTWVHLQSGPDGLSPQAEANGEGGDHRSQQRPQTSKFAWRQRGRSLGMNPGQDHLPSGPDHSALGGTMWLPSEAAGV